DVEGEAVVYGVDAAVGAEEAVAALPVRVVGEEVEEADLLELCPVLGALEEREIVLLEVRLHEELERALAERPLSQRGEGDEARPERFREPVGGDLALVEAGGEIPEGALAPLRLVDGEPGYLAEGQFGEQRHVAAPRQSALDADRAARQEIKLWVGRH